MILLRLFWEFFKTGMFSVGGGLATLPFIYDISDKTGWFTHQQIADMIAVAESTPGPIGINMATYVGFTTAGVVGSLVATLGAVAFHDALFSPDLDGRRSPVAASAPSQPSPRSFPTLSARGISRDGSLTNSTKKIRSTPRLSSRSRANSTAPSRRSTRARRP